MIDILVDFLSWYAVVGLISLAALPLTFQLFAALPDCGYAFAKSMGILLVGGVLWLGTSYGVLRNEAGGAWLSLLIVAILSSTVGWPVLRGWLRLHNTKHATRLFPSVRYILMAEALFLLAFVAWTWVRAHDPAINHTEQPMDLMFMSGIWTSPTFPPRDPWLADYAVSYYYLGYWLLVTVARLAAQPPEIAYNLGQACWFGLLILGSFGVGYNLIAASTRKQLAVNERAEQKVSAEQEEGAEQEVKGSFAFLGGLLTAAAVGLTGNLHAIMEWFHAQGINVMPLATWADVPNFPENAPVTRQWFIDAGWSWWWRSSRVIGDTDLLGNHIEVIDEFPIFSYVLGDNHPHVLAMPFVLLVVGLALNFFFWRQNEKRQRPEDGSSFNDERQSPFSAAWRALLDAIPGRMGGLIVLVVATGALVPINTWDFPPYWALLTVVALFVIAGRRGLVVGLWSAGLLAAILLLGMMAVYFPYFLTAQSQAGGVIPNFFNPTRLPQFLLMFGHLLLGVGALIGLAWGEEPPSLQTTALSVVLVLGLPLIFLGGSLLVAVNSEAGMAMLQRMALPPEVESYTSAILSRWLTHPWTFFLAGSLAAVVLALLWRRLTAPTESSDAGTTFALFLAGIGLLLIFAPEFVYLRDNFGTRMNTVFKFYYQGWLLLAVSSSYAIVTVLARLRLPLGRSIPAAVCSGAALLLILAGLIYPVAGAYAKIQGFGTTQPTLNGLAYIGADETAAIEWIRRNTSPADLVLQSKGRSYWATDNRVNAATGRATLLGWDGHQSQWRGPAYGEMAVGRKEMVEMIYRSGSPIAIQDALAAADIQYVYVGPVEREQYGISPTVEVRLSQVMDLVFEQGNVHIYRRRG